MQRYSHESQFNATLFLKVKRFDPHLFYHLAEPANLASIRAHGLLSTECLLELSGLNSTLREKFLNSHRPGPITLSNGLIIRGQEPMPPKLLAPALRDGITPGNWYRFLNGFVFLWANNERAFAGTRQVLLEFDAKRLLKDLGDKIFLSPINSGNARRQAVPRSKKLFVPYHTWVNDGWAEIDGKRRADSSPPVEVVLERHLPLHPYLLRIKG
jgi:hypothetical protein